MRKIAVLSGKGGVGKSSVCALVSMALSEHSKVVLLDFDICGPSAAAILNATGKVYKRARGLSPIPATENLSLVSMSSLMGQSDSVIWRGPKKVAVLSMFFESIEGYDYVVVDTPPGLAEEHWFLCDRGFDAIIVTTPQNAALSDSRSSIEFCHRNGIPILGLFENMAGLACEGCSRITNVFGAKGGEKLANSYSIRCLGRLPIEQAFLEAVASGDLLQRGSSLKSYTIVLDGIRSVV